MVNGHDRSKILLVQRPEDDQEFPGIWGLPAVSLGLGETPGEAARRIGPQKLGTEVRLGYRVASGKQKRPEYTLEMSLYEATLDRLPPTLPVKPSFGTRVTLYTGWRWGVPQDLRVPALRGSLCSQLLLDWLGASSLGPNEGPCR